MANCHSESILVETEKKITVEEARELVDALGLDPELLQQRVESPRAETADTTGEEPGDSEPAALEDGLPSMEQIQAM